MQNQLLMRRNGSPPLLIAAVLILAAMLVGASPKKNPTFSLIRKLLNGYEAYPPPNGPTEVRLGIYINYFYAMSEQSMDYRLSFYMRREWYDTRLQFNQTQNHNIAKLKLDDKVIDRLWFPDLFFRNEKSASFHKVTQNNRLFYIHSDGRIWYVSKISATFSCPMKLHKYPLDRQYCPLYFQSVGYTTKEIVYKWLNNSVEFDSTAKNLPEMVIADEVETDECTFNATSGYQPGEYPCLVVRFIASRPLGYFMIQFYIPSILLVSLSWVSFWISADAVVARVSMGLLTVLNLVTQSTGSRNQLPRVSYVKAIDVWMTACLVFAFASLIEFAIVNVWSRTEARDKKRQQAKDAAAGAAGPTPGPTAAPPAPGPAKPEPASTARNQAPPTATSLATGPVHDKELSASQTTLAVTGQSSAQSTGHRKRRYSDLSNIISQPLMSIQQHRALALDQLSRRIFPFTFLIFNVVYWVVYSFMND